MMKIKNKLLLLLLIPISLIAQENGVEYYNDSNGVLKNIFDSYGNKLSLEDIKIDSSPVNNNGNKAVNNQLLCSSGIFELYFEAGSGMENTSNPLHNQRRNVLCQVFTDISNFLQTNLHYSSTTKVKIWVRAIGKTPDFTNGLVSYGSGYYHFPIPNTQIMGGIIDNEVWKTIHAGVDSYTNIIPPLIGNNSINIIDATNYYHGAIAFNFNPASIWNYNLTSTIPSNKMDFYTVALKEVGHLLGVVSLINQDGNSVFGSQNKYYSRFDTFLKNNQNQSLILNPAGCSSMYDYNYTLSNTFLNSNCTTPYITNNTVCSSAITYSGSVNLPVYTPNCFESRKSLSHLEDQCIPPFINDNYFVMSNNNLNGIIKRYFKPQEKSVLGDIGYTLNSTFGTVISNNFYNYVTPSDGIKVAGVNDGLNNTSFIFTGNASTPITINGILNNDANFSSGFSTSNIANLRFECLQDVYQNSSSTTITASGNDANAVITFTSSVTGLHLLRYVPFDVATGMRGNITYVYVFVNPVNAFNNACGTVTNCNLVINGDFEQYSSLPTYFSQFEKACNWKTGTSISSPDYFHTNATGNVKIPVNFAGNQLPNNNFGNGYAGVWCAKNSRGRSYREHIATQLAEPLRPNTTYTLKFDVSQSDRSLTNNPAKLQACLTNFVPGGLYGGSFTNYDLPISAGDILLTNTSYTTNRTGWDTITFVFTTGSVAGHKYLYLGGLNNVDFLNQAIPPTSDFYYYYIDNVSLVPEYGNIINLPTNICLNKTINNLAQYIVTAPIGGVFTGAGVTQVGGVYSFDATVAGVGAHIITYTFNDNVGCPPVIINKTINVNECGIPYISQVFANGNNDKAIEVKNLSNTQAIMPGTHYLVWYQGNGAPANLTTPTASIDLASNSNIPANGVKVFKSSALANPAYVVATGEPFTTFENYDGIHDILIISTSNGANAYNDRIDIIGDNTFNPVFYKDYTLESYASLVRVSCPQVTFPKITYNEEDWVGFSLAETNNNTDRKNSILGRHYSEILVWNGIWDDTNGTNLPNASNPDRSRYEIMNFPYNTNTFGSFEACSMIVNTDLNITPNNYVKVQANVNVNAPLGFQILNVQDGGALVMARDCFYGDCGTALSSTGMSLKRNTTGLLGPYDYVYWSSPLSSNTSNPTAGQIFNFGSGTGPVFNMGRFYSFENQNYCDIYRKYNVAQPAAPNPDGYDDDLNDYLPFTHSFNINAQNQQLIPGRGYNTWPPTPIAGNYNYQINFKGEMNNGVVSVPVYKNNSLSGKNSNLVGNPYPSAIDLDKFFAVNASIIEPIAYIWSRISDDPTSTPGPNGYNYLAGNYTVYTQDFILNDQFNSSFGGGNTLSSGQSFFVRTKKRLEDFSGIFIPAETVPTNINPATHPLQQIAPAGDLIFKNVMRTTAPNTTFSRMANNNTKNSAESDKLSVNLTDTNNFTVQIGIGFKATASANYMQGEDFSTIGGIKYNFYTQSTPEDLMIDIQDSFNTDKVIQLGITNTSDIPNQSFSISLSKKSGVFNSQEVYLFDSLLNVYHNLSNSSYSFTTNGIITENRFSLRFTQNNSNLAQNKYNNQVEANLINDKLSIQSINQNIKSVWVYDLYSSSSLITNQANINSKIVNLSIGKNHKLLSVKIELEDGTIITKKMGK